MYTWIGFTSLLPLLRYSRLCPCIASFYVYTRYKFDSELLCVMHLNSGSTRTTLISFRSCACDTIRASVTVGSI